MINFYFPVVIPSLYNSKQNRDCKKYMYSHEKRESLKSLLWLKSRHESSAISDR